MLLRWRRPLAALLAFLSVLLGLSAMRSAPPGRATGEPTVPVLVAAHDLSAGEVLREGDARVAAYPAGLAPDGVFRPPAAVTGRRLVMPVRAGEPLTDVRFVSTELIARLLGTGAVAAPVRIADAGEVALVRPGDRVDVLAAPTSEVSDQVGGGPIAGHAARPVASGAVVLSVPRSAASGSTDGGLVVLAVPSETALSLAGAAASDRLSLVLRP